MKNSILIFAILFAVNSVFAQNTSKKYKKMPDGLYAEIQTAKGNIVCFLEFQKAPLTVANFVGLAEGTLENKAIPVGTPFYDGLKFHRVVKDFVIQGGDPQGNGTGGPGYKFKNEIVTDLKHDKPGTLAMANSGPNTNGSQFYITLKETPFLDGSYNVFGHVVEGMDVVTSIQQGDTINKIKIIRVGKEAKKFDAVKTFNEMK